MASAAYLAEHLAEVPAIVIPTIIGKHDGDGRPGLFDSVIQAAWSFCPRCGPAGSAPPGSPPRCRTPTWSRRSSASPST